MWGPLVASGTLVNGVIMPSNPYSQFLQPNMKWVHSIPKIRCATKQMDGSAPSPKSGLDSTQPIDPATKHTVHQLPLLVSARSCILQPTHDISHGISFNRQD